MNKSQLETFHSHLDIIIDILKSQCLQIAFITCPLQIHIPALNSQIKDTELYLQELSQQYSEFKVYGLVAKQENPTSLHTEGITQIVSTPVTSTYTYIHAATIHCIIKML